MQIIPIVYNEITAPFWVLGTSISLSKSFPLDESFILDEDLGTWFFSDLLDDPDGGYIDRLEKTRTEGSVRGPQVIEAIYGR